MPDKEKIDPSGTMPVDVRDTERLDLFPVPTEKEVNKLYEDRGIAPIANPGPEPGPPAVNDPHPDLPQELRMQAFIAPNAGGEQPEWFVGGVARADLMPDDVRKHYGINKDGSPSKTKTAIKELTTPQPPTPPTPTPTTTPTPTPTGTGAGHGGNQ
jgi:hypothetical protein